MNERRLGGSVARAGNLHKASLQLPHDLVGYLQSPRFTWQRVRGWLNAEVQLRTCTHVGRWTRVSGKVSVHNSGSIVIGERVQIISTFARTVLVALSGGVLEIGDRSLLNYGVDVAATRRVTIGDDCLIGTHVLILDNDFHGVAVLDRNKAPEAKPVLLGNRVWVGSRAIILPGVTIGEGSVVGAGSVVTADIPPGSVAVGNPARVIRKL